MQKYELRHANREPLPDAAVKVRSETRECLLEPEKNTREKHRKGRKKRKERTG